MTHTRHYYNSKRFKPRRIKPGQRPRSIRCLFGKIALELGDAAERHVDMAFADAQKNGQLPKWLTGWERQEKYSPADRCGVDFIFTTDVGKILVQIKSSEANAESFKLAHPDCDIVVVVVNILDPHENIFWKIVNAIRNRRKDMLQNRVVKK